MERGSVCLTDDGDARNFIQNEEKGRKESESGGDGKFNGSGVIIGGGEAILFSTLFSGISQRGEKRANRRELGRESEERSQHMKKHVNHVASLLSPMPNVRHVVMNDRSHSRTFMEGNVLRFDIGLAPLSPFDVGKSATRLRSVVILQTFCVPCVSQFAVMSKHDKLNLTIFLLPGIGIVQSKTTERRSL